MRCVRSPMASRLWTVLRRRPVLLPASAANSAIIPAILKRSAAKKKTRRGRPCPQHCRPYRRRRANSTRRGEKVTTLAKEVPLGIKTLYAMGTGAGIGGVQGLSGTKDLTDLPQAAKDTAIGTIVGAGVGGAIPGAAKVIGAGYEKAANLLGGKVDGMSRLASLQLIKGVEADGPTLYEHASLNWVPDAMLADAGPALMGKLQGSVLNSDEGRSIGTNALTARDKERTPASGRTWMALLDPISAAIRRPLAMRYWRIDPPSMR